MAELPRATPVAAYVAPTGKSIRVPRGGDLQRALNTARCGDQVLLAPGATYEGKFVLPLRQCTLNKPITVRTAPMGTDMPLDGVRITPTTAVNLARLMSTQVGGTLATAPGTSGWRVMLLDITAAPELPALNAIVLLGDGSRAQSTLSLVPTDLILDRVYVHAQPQQRVQRCISLQSANTAIVNSWIDECHTVGQDAQAIVAWGGPGPYLIENNFLAGSGENVHFGGADPAIPDLVPSDITIRRNHIYKPLAWKGVWLVKNLLEIKNAERVLVEGNVFDGSWTDGQVGFAFNLKSVNQDRTAPWSRAAEVTIRFNRISNVGGGFSLLGRDAPNVTTYAHHITIAHNVLSDVNTGPYQGTGRIFQALDGVTDVRIEHNTFVGVGPVNSLLTLAGPAPLTGWVIRNNILDLGQYGVVGGGVTRGNPSFDRFMPGLYWERNVIFGAGAQGFYPRSTFLASSIAAIGFTDVRMGQFALIESSPYRTTASDGADLGVDMKALDSATAGVVVTP